VVLGVVLSVAAGCGGESNSTTSASTTSSQPTTTTSADNGGHQPVGDGRGGVGLDQIGSFTSPVYVTQPPSGDDGLYVVEQGGTIKRIPPGGGEPTTFLDITSQVTSGGEQGLLSVAFAPDYAKSGLLYVDFTGTDQDQHVVEYHRAGSGEQADPDSARELVHIDDFAPNHNGGLLLFGPDGDLYLGMGDGGGAGDPERTAQDLDSPLGKLLRVDREKGGDEVAAYGLRNPWRYSFDRDTGDLWIGDVGQDTLEEIDAVTAKDLASGRKLNFGWSAFEGNHRFNDDQQAPGAIPPVFEYSHDSGGCSVTGGYVVRDPALRTLWGRYLYGDYCVGQLHSFTADPAGDGGDDRELGVEVPSLTSFGEDRDGHLYAVSGSGPVYRLVGKG
jgi:glucose/arabinose dehydrogenase